jgi:phage shock protein A
LETGVVVGYDGSVSNRHRPTGITKEGQAARATRSGATMILGKIWKAIAAQFNKLANAIRGYDPVAEMQYEYDRSVEQIREGREGLAQYRALVERVSRQVGQERKRVAVLEAKIKAYLQSGDRDAAAKSAHELKRAKEEQAENDKQLAMHEQAYQNNLVKIQHAVGKLDEVKHKIAKYDSELKMSRAEAEISQLASQFHFDVTTDFGQAEQIIQEQIDRNRARVRVAADLSKEGLEDIEREVAVEKTMAEDALREFEIQQGLVTPETTKAPASAKELGPAVKGLEPVKEV